MTAGLPERPNHATLVQNNLREHIESVQPGDAAVLDRRQLGLSDAEFSSLHALLRDLEQAGAVKLGETCSTDKIEFERLL